MIVEALAVTVIALVVMKFTLPGPLSGTLVTLGDAFAGNFDRVSSTFSEDFKSVSETFWAPWNAIMTAVASLLGGFGNAIGGSSAATITGSTSGGYEYFESGFVMDKTNHHRLIETAPQTVRYKLSTLIIPRSAAEANPQRPEVCCSEDYYYNVYIPACPAPASMPSWECYLFHSAIVNTLYKGGGLSDPAFTAAREFADSYGLGAILQAAHWLP